MTRPQFLEPQGELDVQLVGDVISLTDCVPPCVAEIEAWTSLERLLVYDWAMREHLSASDNKIRRRPKPFLLERVGEYGRGTRSHSYRPASPRSRSCARCTASASTSRRAPTNRRSLTMTQSTEILVCPKCQGTEYEMYEGGMAGDQGGLPVCKVDGARMLQRLAPVPPTRERLPELRAGFTKVFRLPYTHRDGTQDMMQLYFTANMTADGRCGEVFVTADRGGSFARGALDAMAMTMSMLLQHGIPLTQITDKFKGIRFKPDGFTGDPEIKSCTSPLDLLARWLELKFLPKAAE